MGLMDRFKVKEEPKTVEPPNDSKRIQGKIIKLSERGYGFITSKEVPFRKIFFHWSALNQDTMPFERCEVGDEVEFELITVQRHGGPSLRAIHIKVLETD